MRFQEKWDKLLMDNWNELNDEMAVITTYPQGFILRDEPLPKVCCCCFTCVLGCLLSSYVFLAYLSSIFFSSSLLYQFRKMTVLCDSRFMEDLAIPRHQVPSPSLLPYFPFSCFLFFNLIDFINLRIFFRKPIQTITLLLLFI